VKLKDVLSPEHVVVPLRAGTVKEATERLAERLVQVGAVAEPQRLNAVIRHTWPEDMVSVGEHAFLPHFRTEAVRGLVAAVGISPAPIRWEKDPNRSARIVIFIVAPLRDAALYLQVVGAFARALSDPDTVLALLAAKTAEQVVRLAALDAVELPSQLTVRDIMTPQAFTVRADQTLGEVAHLMIEQDIRAMPVVDDASSLIGMVTHRELLRHLIPDFLQRTKTGEVRAPTRSQLQRASTDPRLILVKEAMARSVLCLSEDQTLADVANLMSSKDVDRFPVVRDMITLAIIKPDAVGAGKAGKILAQLESAGFKIRAARLVKLTTAQAEAFYAVHRERPFYRSLVAFMTSGPALAVALQRDDAVARLRDVIGATDPAEAKPGTVRKLYAESKERNAIHASDAPETAAREVAFFFPERELHELA